jgi:aldehyde:ferredoxin oxidoreductase
MSKEAGYAGKILRVDLSSGSTATVDTSKYAPKFIGGRGIAAKIYWDEVSPQVDPFDPENRLLFFTGPVAGFAQLAGSRWQVCGKSPATDTKQFCYSNLGGHWGAGLKFAGYDGLIIQGQSDKPVYLLIRDDTVEIRDAVSLWGKGAVRVRETLKAELGNSVRVVAAGPAGDNLVSFASLQADNDSSGSCGFGAVMGSKNLKAIAVRGSGSVRAAQPERLRELARHIRQLKAGTEETSQAQAAGSKIRVEACYGCTHDGCSRTVFEASDGTRGKFMCQSGVFYQERARRYSEEPVEVAFRANRLCDDYGLDTDAIDNIIKWLSRCHQAGILNEDNTGLPLSQMGSLEFIERLVRNIALREGFGDVLAQGIHKAAQTVGQGTQDLITDYVIKAGQSSHYGGQLYITTGLFYAMEPRYPIQQLHEVSRLVMTWLRWANQRDGYLSSSILRAIASRFWGSEIAGDFSTYEGKALAAIKIQDRQYAKESLVLCDFFWPIMNVANSEDHVGDPTLESQIFSAVTGKETNEEEMYRFGERVFNLQRSILAREGHHGRESDRLPDTFFTKPLKNPFGNPECQVPGRDGELFSRKGMVIDREEFEDMKTEYYRLRGWDPVTGLQKKEQLEELGLADTVDDLNKYELLA